MTSSKRDRIFHALTGDITAARTFLADVAHAQLEDATAERLLHKRERERAKAAQGHLKVAGILNSLLSPAGQARAVRVAAVAGVEPMALLESLDEVRETAYRLRKEAKEVRDNAAAQVGDTGVSLLEAESIVKDLRFIFGAALDEAPAPVEREEAPVEAEETPAPVETPVTVVTPEPRRTVHVPEKTTLHPWRGLHQQFPRVEGGDTFTVGTKTENGQPPPQGMAFKRLGDNQVQVLMAYSTDETIDAPSPGAIIGLERAVNFLGGYTVEAYSRRLGFNWDNIMVLKRKTLEKRTERKRINRPGQVETLTSAMADALRVAGLVG